MGPSNFTHPSKRIDSSYSSLLQGKKIGLGITGSVAAFLSPAIARELMRHGADVIPIMTTSGLEMIGKNLMWWATGNEPITEVTGKLEHISMAGVMNDPLDLLLIAPCTTNTVGKIASGIADTSVTLIASSLSGKGIPIMVLCVAHIDLINSPAIQNSLSTLQERGIHVIDPVVKEGKAKVPDVEELTYEVLTKLSTPSLEKQNIIVTAGPTREYIDNVRFITNESSGKMGVEIAKASRRQNGQTILVHGPTNEFIPRMLSTEAVFTTQEMTDAVLSKLEETPQSIVVLAAAMADFTPKDQKSGKTKSGTDFTIELTSTPKLSDKIKSDYPESTLVLFKAEWEVTIEELRNRAYKKLQKCNADFIVANDLSQPDAGFETTTNHVIIVDKDGDYEKISGPKSELANIIINRISNIIMKS